MRYADAPSVGTDVFIDAAPSRVWELVTDIELPARLSPELQRVEWLRGATGPELGASFAGHNRNPALGEWRTTSHIVELDPEQLFAWAVVDADGLFGEPVTDPSRALATWRFELAGEHGGTRLRQSATIGPGRSGLNLAIDRMPEHEDRIISDRLAELRARIDTTLAAIKTLAEAR